MRYFQAASEGRCQEVLNLTPLNHTPATCHKRTRKLRCNFRNAALQKLHCNIRFLQCRSVFYQSFAASEKLQCNIEKAALQESAAFLPLSCRFQAPTFRHPRFGPADVRLSETFRVVFRVLFRVFVPFFFWAAANGGVTNGGLRGVRLSFLKIGRSRFFFGLFLPFLPFSGGSKEHLENPGDGGKRPFFLRYPQICFSPHLLKPPFAAVQRIWRARKRVLCKRAL